MLTEACCLQPASQGAGVRAKGRAGQASHANLAAVLAPLPPPIILCHLCGWIERIPGGTRQNDGLETRYYRGGSTAARLAWL